MLNLNSYGLITKRPQSPFSLRDSELIFTPLLNWANLEHHPPFPFHFNLPQYIQVDWCGFHQSKKYLLNVLNIEALLWLPLPATQHHIIDFLWTEPGPLQYPTLSDALYHLEKHRDKNILLYIIYMYVHTIQYNNTTIDLI